MAYPEPLPDAASLNEEGHVEDHNQIVDAVRSIDSRLNATEGTSSTHENRLDSAESSLTSLDGRLDTAESSLTSLDGRLDTVEAASYQSTAQKGQPNGYAALDGTGKVPVSQVPSNPVSAVLVKGVATWATINALPSPVAGDLWVLQAADAGAPTRPGGGAAQSGDGIVRTATPSWVNTGPFQGPAGADGSAGSALFPLWQPGVDYAVGQVARHEGEAWMLTADDPLNGRTTKISVLAQHSRDVVASSANQVWTTPPVLTNNSVVVCFVIYSQVAAQNVTASVGTEIPTAAVNMNYDGKNTGVKVFYTTSTEVGQNVPIVNLNGGTARIVWVALDGINRTIGPTAIQTSAAAAPTNTNNIAVGSTTGTDNDFALMAVSFARASGGARGWVGTGGDWGSRIGRGHAFETSSNAMFDDKWVPWVSAVTRNAQTSNVGAQYTVAANNNLALSGSAQRVATVIHFTPAVNGHPFFDRSKWRRLTGENRPAQKVNADDLAFGRQRIRLPEADRTYTITLSARTSGNQSGTTVLYLPELTEAEKQTHHSIRVIAKVEDVRRMLVFWTQRPINVSDSGGSTGGNFSSGPLVEFGSEPGSLSWIDLNYEPDLFSWSVSDSGGDRILRDTRIYTEERRGNYIPEIGFPLYFTPEVTATERLNVASAITWIPLGVRRIMGSRGMVAEIGKTVADTSGDRSANTETAGTYIAGQAVISDMVAYGSTSIQQGVEGWVALHEIGHLVDSKWVNALNLYKNRQGDPWASLPSIPYGQLQDAFYDELILASNNPGVGSYALTNYGEYFAELFAAAMCAQRYMDSGQNYANFSLGKTNIVGTGDPDNLWPGIEAKMKSFGLLTYAGTLT